MCVLRLMDSMVVDSDKHDNMIPWVWSKELGSVKKNITQHQCYSVIKKMIQI